MVLSPGAIVLARTIADPMEEALREASLLAVQRRTLLAHRLGHRMHRREREQLTEIAPLRQTHTSRTRSLRWISGSSIEPDLQITLLPRSW
jgi:hypothetical protein